MSVSLQFGAHPVYYGLIGLNITTVFVAAAVLIVALIFRVKRKDTWLFELSLLLLLISFLFVTLHGRLLQYVFPVSLPERPLVDNNLTINYFLANVLAYAFFPLLVIRALRGKITAQEIGLRINNPQRTVKYAVLGVFFASSIYLLTNFFFHEQWVTGYTSEGLVTWVILVTVISAFLQTLFYNCILFNRYVHKENVLLLGLIGVFAFQSFVAANTLPWLACNILTVSSELAVTWKTRSIYGAFLMAMAVGLLELTLQIL